MKLQKIPTTNTYVNLDQVCAIEITENYFNVFIVATPVAIASVQITNNKNLENELRSFFGVRD